MIIRRFDSWVHGLRMYNITGDVIFTTGGWIEKNINYNLLLRRISFVIMPNERIIGIRSHDDGHGNSNHFNI